MLPPETPEDDPIHSETFLRSLMRRQLALSISCALAFVVLLFGLPLANFLAPELMARPVLGGFTLSWFLLGIGCFPVVWLIAWVFIRRSIALEQTEVAEVTGLRPSGTDRKRLGPPDSRKGAERLMGVPPRRN